MGYLTVSFAVFVIITAVFFYIVPKKIRPVILLLANLLFCFSFGYEHLLFLLLVAATTYLTARFLPTAKRKKTLFILCLALNIAVWFSIKQLPWLTDLTNIFQPTKISPWENLIIPIGISYYTLQGIGYMADVYKEKILPEKNFFKYLLFLSFFPAFVQGPISRYGQLSAQLSCNAKFDLESITYSITQILIGLVKKMVLADRLAIFVNHCFSSYQQYHGIVLYIGAVFYAIQLYADFSGCVDICRGVSGLFGIELIPNFNAPYLSKSIREFWNRWHLSLSSWLKDYVYIPLGGNRKGSLRKYLNLALTFLVSGIWHGAGFTYLIWGLLQAAYQIVGTLTASVRKKAKTFLQITPDSLTDKCFRIVITFNLTVFSWIFFRADSVSSALQYIVNMSSRFTPAALFSQDLFSLGLNYFFFTVVILHIFLLALSDFCQVKSKDPVRVIRQQHLLLRWTIYFLLIFDILLFGVYGRGYSISSFMYGGF